MPIRLRQTHGPTGRFSVAEILGDDRARAGRLLRVGEIVVKRLKDRTRSGRDEHGRAFRPYTPRYAAWKAHRLGRRRLARDARGRFAGGRASLPVDLTLSGDMLAALQVIHATPRVVRIGFVSAAMARRAGYNEAQGRRFLGVPQAWLDQITRTALEARRT